MKKNIVLSLFVLLVFALATSASASDPVVVKGKVYIDYYGVGAVATNSLTSARLGEFKHLGNTTNAIGANGFQLRRIYLTLDKKLADNVKARVRFETGNSTYGINSDKSLIPFAKDAWIKWNYMDNQTIAFGIQGPGALGFYEEKLWGLRAVEKVPEDYTGIISSRDFGIKLSGKMSDLSYSFMIGNGHGSETEDGSTKDNAKKAFGNLTYHVGDNIVAELYGDSVVLPNKDMYGKEQATGHLLLGYISDSIRAGVQYVYQDSVAKNSQLNIFSVPVVYNMSDAFSVYGRFDYYTINKFDPTTGKANNMFIIAGADYQVVKNFHIMPNIETSMYSQEKNNPGSAMDMVARLTVYFKY